MNVPASHEVLIPGPIDLSHSMDYLCEAISSLENILMKWTNWSERVFLEEKLLNIYFNGLSRQKTLYVLKLKFSKYSHLKWCFIDRKENEE